MASTPTFRGWLDNELKQQGVSRRELARRLAAGHPEGVTPKTLETYRRAIYKYLDPSKQRTPTEPTRLAFAAALGVDPALVPTDEEDDEDEPDVAATLQALAREHADISRRINRALLAIEREETTTV